MKREFKVNMEKHRFQHRVHVVDVRRGHDAPVLTAAQENASYTEIQGCTF